MPDATEDHAEPSEDGGPPTTEASIELSLGEGMPAVNVQLSGPGRPERLGGVALAMIFAVAGVGAWFFLVARGFALPVAFLASSFFEAAGALTYIWVRRHNGSRREPGKPLG